MDEIFAMIEKEHQRQSLNLELIASENYASAAVMAATGSCLTNKYAEGYPGRRYYGGCMFVDEIESLARERACRLFGAEHANVQAHSGSQANMAAYAALLKPGDGILSPDLNAGGHLTHSSPVSFVSRDYQVYTYGVNEAGWFDMDEVREKALKYRPKIILTGASAYPRIIDFPAFRAICDEIGAYLVVDMAHIAGLVAGGVHPSPVPYADVVTSTTHKTLRGPRGGLILCRAQYAKAIDKAVFPLLQGGGLQHVVAAKGVCFGEALEPSFAEYAANIVQNAAVLADTLKENGFELVTGGTENHLMLVILREITGKQAETLLDEAGITVNKNMIPNDTRKPNETSGIRIGTAAVTTRGMGPEEMKIIGSCIARVLKQGEDPVSVRRDVQALTSRFPLW